MIKVGVSVENIQEIFDTSYEEIHAAIDGKLDVVAVVVKEKAQASSEFADRATKHRKPGTLRKSIHKRKSKFEDGGYIVYSNDNIAHLVEYGHSMVLWGVPTDGRVAAHPYMRKAKIDGIIKAVEIFREDTK